MHPLRDSLAYPPGRLVTSSTKAFFTKFTTRSDVTIVAALLHATRSWRVEHGKVEREGKGSMMHLELGLLCILLLGVLLLMYVMLMGDSERHERVCGVTPFH
jgi:hypothetical protein